MDTTDHSQLVEMQASIVLVCACQRICWHSREQSCPCNSSSAYLLLSLEKQAAEYHFQVFLSASSVGMQEGKAVLTKLFKSA